MEWETLHLEELCRTLPLATPRGPRLDALPLFVRTLRSRTSSRVFGPALCPGAPLPLFERDLRPASSTT